MRHAALFDFDNTLIDGDSQGLEVEYFRRRREISLGRLAYIALVYLLYKIKTAPKAALVRSCIGAYRGWEKQGLIEHGNHFFREVTSHRFFPEVIDRMREHKNRGDLVAVLSASPAHLVGPAAKFLGVDLLIATEIEEDSDGRLTGRTRGPVNIGSVKAAAAGALLEEHGIDPARCTAYSDDQADLEFLLMAGAAVAVNPTRKLARIAEVHGWEVIHPFSNGRRLD